MTKLSAYILAKDEAENAAPLMESLAGVDDVVVLDNGSTDGTVELFRKLGARVFDGTKIGKHLVTEGDVMEFEARFGYAPRFTAGSVFDDSGARRNYAASLCRNDWVVNPDCDERVEWDLKKVKAQLNGQPALRHRYVHKHNADGSPLVEFVQCKIYNRRLGKYLGRIHEVLVRMDMDTPPVTSPYTSDFVLHHWQKERAWRSNHIDQLEYQAMKEETPRNLHYLAKEYLDAREFDKALVIYDRYFSAPGEMPEQVSQAWIARAEAYREMKQTDKAVSAYHEAMVLDDTRREPFFLLATLYMEQRQWRKALIYLHAALIIPYNPQGYGNDMRLYTWAIHDSLSVCYLSLGLREQAKAHWIEALKHLPEGSEAVRILANGKWMFREVRSAECGAGNETN